MVKELLVLTSRPLCAPFCSLFFYLLLCLLCFNVLESQGAEIVGQQPPQQLPPVVPTTDTINVHGDQLAQLLNTPNNGGFFLTTSNNNGSGPNSVKVTIAVITLDIPLGPKGAFGIQCWTNCTNVSHFGAEYSYYFCYGRGAAYDYCSPKNGADYRGLPCTDSCDYREQTVYKWCHTVEDWGYCT